MPSLYSVSRVISSSEEKYDDSMKGSDNEDNGNYDGDSDDFEDTWPFGGEGEADDVPMPKGTSCLQINKALARTEKIAGEFTFGGPADSLPATSGLFVKEFGPVPLPLHEDVANKLIAVCEKSPFGRKKETLVDDKVRKSWQLDASQVELKNPLWEDGLAKLSSTIAERLGYKDVPLQCKLYKMLVYAEGGHFAKHKDTEKEDGMIATLVVQPPSLHEGGDLVVHRDTSTQYRHDFGEADGTAAYVPHYAVHYADAEHSLEEVTKGYRLVLVYSICLPLTMHLSPRGFDKELLEELTNAINKMKTGDDSFALLLSHQYTAKSIEDLGSGAFKGVDRARFHALQEANAGASPDKKVHLFIAKLAHKIHLYDEAMGDGSWKKDEECESIKWFATSGQNLGQVDKSTTAFNFLNPGQDTLYRLWRPYGSSTFEGSLGNEAPTRDTTYSRFALIAVSTVTGPVNALKIVNEDCVVAVLQAEKCSDAAMLSAFMDAVAALTEKEYNFLPPEPRHHSVGFFRGLCELLVDVGDPDLVNRMFNEFWSRLTHKYGKSLKQRRVKEYTRALVPSVVNIIRAFDWNAVGQAVLTSLGAMDSEIAMDMALLVIDHLQSESAINQAIQSSLEGKEGVSTAEKALLVVDRQQCGAAIGELLRVATDKATALSDQKLLASKSLGLLWKLTIRSGNKSVFEAMVDRFKKVDPSELRSSIEEFSRYLAELEGAHGKVAMLSSIVDLRIKWLNHHIRGLDKPFSWEMPDASFPGDAMVEEFLRGPDVSMNTTQQFGGIQEARNYAATCIRKKQINSSFEMEAKGKGKKAFVTITKTRQWYSKRQEELQQDKAELSFLMERYGGGSSGQES